MDHYVSLDEHWSGVYWMIPEHAFDHSRVLRVGEDCVIVDGEEFWKAPF